MNTLEKKRPCVYIEGYHRIPFPKFGGLGKNSEILYDYQ
jgi:hypothetical protein